MPIKSMSLLREDENEFHPLVYVLAPVGAILLQVYVPHVFVHFAYVDVTLLMVIYFAIMLRSPIRGTLAGMVIGLAQDALSGQAIGVNGMAKATVAYAAASIGARIDVENSLTRLLLTAVFTLGNEVLVYVIQRHLMGLQLQWMWMHELARVTTNAVLGVALFWMMDRLRRRG